MNRRTFTKLLASALPASWLASRVKGESVAPPVEPKAVNPDQWHTFSITYSKPSVSGVRYWRAGASGNWNDPANWSYTKDGPGGATPPTAGDTAFFMNGGCLDS